MFQAGEVVGIQRAFATDGEADAMHRYGKTFGKGAQLRQRPATITHVVLGVDLEPADRGGIVKKLRDAEVMLNNGKSMEEVLKLLEVSEATFNRWRNQYGGMKSEEAKRLKDLEGENARLKRLLAESELDKAMLKEALRGND